jgi:very-short-patch-repair endonuclease
LIDVVFLKANGKRDSILAEIISKIERGYFDASFGIACADIPCPRDRGISEPRFFFSPFFQKGDSINLGGRSVPYYNRHLKKLARTLRSNMTDTERLLWSRIRRKQLKGYQFYRQKTIGNYIVDFYCPSGKLIIEVDGSRHYEEKGLRKDRIRDRYLNELGFQVLRIPSNEVFDNIDGVVSEIYDRLPEESPRPPLEKGESCSR